MWDDCTEGYFAGSMGCTRQCSPGRGDHTDTTHRKEQLVTFTEKHMPILYSRSHVVFLRSVLIP